MQKSNHFLILALILFSLSTFGQEKLNYKWWDPAETELPVIEGQFWGPEVKSTYDRLPERAEGVVRNAVWNLSRQSAGQWSFPGPLLAGRQHLWLLKDSYRHHSPNVDAAPGKTLDHAVPVDDIFADFDSIGPGNRTFMLAGIDLVGLAFGYCLIGSNPGSQLGFSLFEGNSGHGQLLQESCGRYYP